MLLKIVEGGGGSQNRNETNNFKNKVMVRESQYSSDGQFRGIYKKKKKGPTARATNLRQRAKQQGT